MNRPKLNHYVPEMLSGRFTDGDGKIYMFNQDHSEKGIIRTIPKNIFAVSRLYDQRREDGTKYYEAESKYLAKIDDQASTVLDKVVHAARKRKTPTLTNDERHAFILYYYTQCKRTPDVLDRPTPSTSDERMDTILSQLIVEHQAAGGKSITPTERENLYSPEFIRTAVIDGMLTLGPVFHALTKCNLEIVLVIDTRERFIIGSNPVLLPRYYHASPWILPSIDWWIPIAPDVAIRADTYNRLTLPSGQSEYLRFDHGQLVRDINIYMFKQSAIVAGDSQELIESVVYEMTVASN